MTLHEAIESVLKQQGRPMTAREIADEINHQGLYQRGDGNPLPTSQIHARVKNYPHLFTKVNSEIGLSNPSFSKSSSSSIVSSPTANVNHPTVKRSTLHEAIQAVIKMNGRLMTPREIANEINSQQLYQRGDGNPVPTSQIHARVKNYPSLFKRIDDKIGLIESSKSSLESEKTEIQLDTLLQTLNNKLINEFAMLDDLTRLLFTAELLIVLKKINLESSSDKHILNLLQNGQLIEVLTLFERDDNYQIHFNSLLESEEVFTIDFVGKVILPIYIKTSGLSEQEVFKTVHSYIQNFGYFGKSSSWEFTTPDFINELMVLLTRPKDNEIVYDPAAGRCYSLLHAHKYNNNAVLVGEELKPDITLLGNLNLLIHNCTDYRVNCSNALSEPLMDKKNADVIISNPPFGAKIRGFSNNSFPRISSDITIDTVFLEMMLSRLNPVTGRIAVLVTDSFLYRSQNLELRKRIIDNDQLEAIISLPQGSFLPYAQVKSSVIIINNLKGQQHKGKVLFIDANESVKISVRNQLVEVDENELRKLIKTISEIFDDKNYAGSFVNYSFTGNEIISIKGFNLSPIQYTSDVLHTIDTIGETEQLLQLNQILTRAESAKIQENANPLKSVQIKDLTERSTDFYLDLGVLDSSKSIPSHYRMLNKSSLLIARVGDKIKPTYFEFTGENIGIINNIFTFEVNTKKINVEYLISQLNSEFFNSQVKLIKTGSGMPTINRQAFLNLKIPVPPISEQLNRLASYKEEQANKYKITQFINDINLVTTSEEVKQEIERFARKIFNDSEHIEFKTEFEFDEFPFSQKDISETRYDKRTKDGLYTNLLLIDNDKRINGVLTIETENKILSEQYSDINAYSNFILQASSKYIQQNTNRLLNEFSHTTKNILKDIHKILNDFLETKNEELLQSMKNNLLKDEEMINYLIKSEGRKREDYLAYNRLIEAHSTVNKHFEFFKRRHKYYTNSVNSNFEEVSLSDFIKKNIDNRLGINLINETIEEDTLVIKTAPIELAFADLIGNALSYSTNEIVDVEVTSKDHYIEFAITNKANSTLSKDNYERLGKEDIKKPDGTYSTGLSNAFKSINEDNEISKATYNFYVKNELFRIIIKLKKK